jgi:hypothetical protein
MAFSSTTTPQSVQIDAPDAPCCSISFDPQLGHSKRDEENAGVGASAAVFAANETLRDMLDAWSQQFDEQCVV